MKKSFFIFISVLTVSVHFANAGLILDLRTTSGGNSLALPSGCAGTVSLELWGVVTGTDAFNTNDGIQSVYAWLVTDNHGITGLTGFSATTSRAYGFTGTPNTEGTLVDNGGIMDLKGSTKTNTCIVRSKAGANIPQYTGLLEPGLPSEDYISLANGAEFKLGTFYYGYSNIQGPGSAFINCAVPTWASVLNKIATWGEDTTTSANNSASSTTDVGIGDGVSIVFLSPEPSVPILLGMGCLTLLAWRRRKRL